MPEDIDDGYTIEKELAEDKKLSFRLPTGMDVATYFGCVGGHIVTLKNGNISTEFDINKDISATVNFIADHLISWWKEEKISRESVGKIDYLLILSLIEILISEHLQQSEVTEKNS